MNYKAKFKILKALDPFGIAICLDVNNSFYIQTCMEISFHGMLYGKSGRGETPQEAIEEHFRIYCEELPSNKSVYCKGKYYRWDECVWRETKPGSRHLT